MALPPRRQVGDPLFLEELALLSPIVPRRINPTASSSSASVTSDVETLIARLDDSALRAQAIIDLNRLMLDERIYARVAQSPELFPKMFHRVKAPERHPKYSFSSDPAVDAAKKKQEIFSVYDQLHYILWRTGSHHGLANLPAWKEQAGTEINFRLTASTARAVQYDAIARLIALFAGQEVRMPAYGHRVGPMWGRVQDGTMSVGTYFKKAAENLGSILSSTDAIGANIRVTDADRGPGAYVSTDSDNYYGPHGITFDPRDLHQLPLSKSLDNTHEVSSERTKDQRHQFRAMGQPIRLTASGRPKYSDIFINTEDPHPGLLTPALQPTTFTPGVLADLTSQLLRTRARAAMVEIWRLNSQSGRRLVVGRPITAVIPGGTHEQPKSNEQVFLMEKLVQELNGLYEPEHWTTQWKSNPLDRIAAAMMDRIAAAMKSAPKQILKETPKSEDKDNPGVDDSEWD
jgi:hypothetical protein